MNYGGICLASTPVLFLKSVDIRREERKFLEHYFFRCSHFINERVALFRSTSNFNPLNVNKLLFGNENLTPEENVTIFKAVQTFIKDTRRFTD